MTAEKPATASRLRIASLPCRRRAPRERVRSITESIIVTITR